MRLKERIHPQFGDSSYSPFHQEGLALETERNVIYYKHTSPTPLGFQLESSQNTLCSILLPSHPDLAQ